MITIDLNKIREALPNRADVKLIKYKGVSPAIECKITPEISDKDFEMCMQWQREILGDAILEFYTEETGHHWFVFLKRIPMEFVNASDENVNSFTGMKLVEDGALVKQNDR